MKKLLLLLTIVSLNSWATIGATSESGLYELNYDSLPHSIALEVMAFTAGVEEILPPSLKNAFASKITIEFVEASEISDTSSVDGVIMGGVKKESFFQSRKDIRKIYLNNVLLEQIVDAHQNGDVSIATQARRVLIHETTHLFDYQRKLLGSEKEFEQMCMNGPHIKKRKFGANTKRDQWESVPKDMVCRSFVKSKRSISESPLFLGLSGWNLNGIIFKTRTQLNHDNTRSPDPYEYKSPSEYLAVNMEFFLTDEEFQCRRPTLNKYLTDVFGFSPFDSESCEVNTKIMPTGSAFKGKRQQLIDIDPKRIYQIHYLFASEGEQIMSKWGHAMFRLVMCRPGREVGPKCLNDVAHDVVLSFRANINDGNIDYIKGLSGGYDSQIFVLSMKEVIDEYVKGEFRDLLSIPLNYSDDQKKYFIMSTLEQYWNYLGAYYFFTNNCATEAMKLVRIANSKDYTFQNKNIFTPLGLMELLEESGISDMSVFADRKQAIKKGFLYPGYDETLKRSFVELKEALNLTQRDFKEYVQGTKALSRRAHIIEVIELYDGKELRKMLAMMAQIEDFVMILQEKSFLSSVMKLMGDQTEKDNYFTDIQDQVNLYMEVKKSIAAGTLVEGGYGIPVDREIVEINEADLEDKFTLLESISDELKEWASASFPSIIFEVTQNAENRQIIMDALYESF